MTDRINRLILIMLASALLVHGIASGKVTVGPYVQFTGPYTAVVRWDTDSATSSVVEYGTTQSLGLAEQNPGSVTVHEITLNNIEYNARYFYRINDGEGGYSDIYSSDFNTTSKTGGWK